MPKAERTKFLTDKFNEVVQASRDELWFKWLSLGLLFKDQDLTGSVTKARGPKNTGRKQPIELSNKQLEALKSIAELFAVYMTIKLLVVSFVQFDSLRARHCPRKLPSNCGWLAQETREAVATALGNPLAALDDIVIIVYMGLITVAFGSLLLASWLNRRQKLETPPLRLVIDPKFELQRIDSSIKLTIDQLINSSRVYDAVQSKNYREQRASLMSSHNNLALRFELDRLRKRDCKFNQGLRHILSGLREDPRGLESLRPKSLRPEFYVEVCSRLRFLLGKPQVASMLTLMIIINGGDFLVPMLTRCSKLSACNPLRVMTLVELLLAAEIFLLTCLSSLLFPVSFFVAFLLVLSQLKIFRATRVDLDECGRLLANDRSSPPDRPMKRDEFLLRTLIKLIVNDQELTSNARSITRLAQEQSYLIVGPVVLIFCHNNLDIPSTAMVRYLMLLFGFLTGNMFALFYAYTHARSTQLARELWSFLATCRETHQDCYCPLVGSRFSSQGLPTDVRCSAFVADMLAKFVLTCGRSPQRHMAEAFGLEMNFSRVLQANSYLVFFYTFTTQIL